MIRIPFTVHGPTAYGISQVFGGEFRSKHPHKPTLGKYPVRIGERWWFQWVCFDNAGYFGTAGTAKEAYRLYGVGRETKN